MIQREEKIWSPIGVFVLTISGTLVLIICGDFNYICNYFNQREIHARCQKTQAIETA